MKPQAGVPRMAEVLLEPQPGVPRMAAVLLEATSSPSSDFRASRLLLESKPALRDDARGAAMVEFALAIMPVLLVFFGTVQWSINAYLSLIVKHAAFSVVRCEAVEHPGMPDSGDEATQCLGTEPGGASVIGKLFAHVSGVSTGDFTIDKTLAPATAETLDSVTVTLNYKCSVPLGNRIACTAGVQKLTATAKFPNQGSVYQPIWISGG
jgi:Flp pilus assembly protein TadG